MKVKFKELFINIASLIMLLGIIIIVILGVGKAKEERKKIAEARAKAAMVKVTEAEKEPVSTSSPKDATPEPPVDLNNPYEKLKNKKDLSVLIIGDNIAQSDGVAEEEKWHNLLGKAIKTSYDAKVNFKLLTGNRLVTAKALEDYTRTEAANKYDLVILCLGEYDIPPMQLAAFKKSYEELIRKIKSVNPNGDVITVVESSIQKNKTYPEAIKEIAEYYELTLVDMRDSFKQSNVAYNKLTNPAGIIPNKDGYIIYSNSIFESIKGNVEKGRKVKALEKSELHKN